MAEFKTFIFPTDKNFLPSDESIKLAISYLSDLYLGHYAPTATKHSKVCFLDSGADFDRFHCPACGCTVKAHDSLDWWYSGIWDEILQEDQPVAVPCCQALVPFEHLGIMHLTGLATFYIEIEGADKDYLPSKAQLWQVGSLLGCNVRHLISVFD